MEAMAVFVDSNSEGGLGQERTRVRASPRHDDSKRDGNGKGNGKGDVIGEGEGEGEGEGKGDGDGVLAACCCYSAATAPLPRCSPATPTPIAHPVTATRMGVAAAGERRSSRVGVGVVGVGGGWWIFVCTTLRCRQSPTQKSCVGAKICRPRHAEISILNG